MTNTALITAAVLELRTAGYLSVDLLYTLSPDEYQLAMDLASREEKD